MLSALTLLYCVYLQEIPGVVTLHVININIYYTRNCGGDSLTIYDGPDPSSPEIGKYCGKSLPPDHQSTTGSLLLYFYTDNYINAGNGFKVSWGKMASLY